MDVGRSSRPGTTSCHNCDNPTINIQIACSVEIFALNLTILWTLDEIRVWFLASSAFIPGADG
jgi:hypothetical protein